uniref:Zinc finger protein, FOG family member 2 n=1 Tax=Paramormyrops kingsleyae TaxID=1676925 RepID=A0A3B3R0U9_9TELE
MSRRKQSNPRQIKHEDGGVQETGDRNSEGRKSRSPPDPENWDGPRELQVVIKDGERQIQSRQSLPVGTTWGPYEGKLEASPDGSLKTKCPTHMWLLDITWPGLDDSKTNCIIYSKSGQLWCTTTKPVVPGDDVVAFAVDLDSQVRAVSQVPPAEGMYPARLLDSIQLLPQQAAMASILPTAVVNKDIFPCKACGIWYRSERNLQAHLMYYCSGRQREGAGAAGEGEGSPLHVASMANVANICPFPQCNKRCSGTQALEMHLSTHSGVKLDEPAPLGTTLRCTICRYTADSAVALQHHILSHLSQAAFRCSHCHISFQNHGEFLQHQDAHRLGAAKLHGGSEGQHSPGSREESQKQAGAEPAGKHDALQSPRSVQNEDAGAGAELERPEKKAAISGSKGDAGTGSKASFSYTRIKSEPSSPRLASSPVQPNMGPTFPMGPFLSQFAFSQDLSMAPQASEILAKMSELVHRRLRHGRNSYPPMVYSPLMPKGATCFECNITFNNLDNYLVHKKHYCNSRWQQLTKSHDYSSVPDKAVETLSPNSKMGPGHPSESDGHLMQSACLNASVLDLISAGSKVPEKEFSGQLKKASTPPGAEDSPNSQQTDLRSPNPSLVENENDPSRTTCEACKITFSRHETYMVHKQYYCATRHDPPTKRACASKVPPVPRTMRSRKRRKMTELSPPDQDSKPPGAHSGLLGLPALGNPCTSQEVIDNLGERFYPRCNMFPGMVPKHLEASLTKLVLASKCNTVNQQETDTPIDLSKKCLEKTGSSPKRLLDYHECTVCKISFNKVESYLAHKQNFCPVTSVQPDDISGLDKAMFPDVKNGSSGFDNIFSKSPAKCDKTTSGRLLSQNGTFFHSNLGTLSGLQTPADLQLLHAKDDGKNLFLPHCFYPRETKKANTPERISPFYGVKPTDYINGTLVGAGEPKEQKQSPNEGSEGGKEQPAPNGFAHPGEEPLSLLPKSRDTAASVNGSTKLEDAASPNEDQPDDSQATDSRCSPSWTSETPTDTESSPSRKTRTEKTSPKTPNSTASAGGGGGKYCHLCNIQFNSLSNFITHKKFYCSSRPAEHVK